MYRSRTKLLEVLSISSELISWMRAWELLWRRSWRLLNHGSRKILTGLRLLAETLLSGRNLRRSIAPGKYENVLDNAPSGHYANYTHPPNLN